MLSCCARNNKIEDEREYVRSKGRQMYVWGGALNHYGIPTTCSLAVADTSSDAKWLYGVWEYNVELDQGSVIQTIGVQITPISCQLAA